MAPGFQDSLFERVHGKVKLKMDTRTGNILSPELMALLRGAETPSCSAERELRFFREMNVQPTPKQLARGRVGRNEPCPCGSGKKFKYCCHHRAQE